MNYISLGYADPLGTFVTLFYLVLIEAVLIAFVIPYTASLLLYAIEGVGVSEMARKLNVARPHGAFIPFYRSKVFGEVADAAAARCGKKRMGLGSLLLWLKTGAAILIVVVIAAMTACIVLAHTASPAAVELCVVLTFVAIILTAAAAITFLVLDYIALYRVFACFSTEYAIPLFLLAIFVSPAGSIILLILSHDQPKA